MLLAKTRRFARPRALVLKQGRTPLQHPPKHNHMKGKLSDQPLAELIREISAKGLSGTLRLERERMQTAIYFEQGRIIFAAANLRTLRLREYLAKRNLLPHAEVEKLPASLSDPALAASLIANGRLGQSELDTVFGCLVSDVLRVALLSQDGSWEFNHRARLDDAIKVDVDVPKLLLEAARRMPLDFVASRFRNPSETLARTSEISRVSNLLAAESLLLSRLDYPMKLAELVAASGLQESEAFRAIYGLALSGLVRREHWQNAFRTEPAQQPVDSGRPPTAEKITIAEAGAESGGTSAGDEEELLKKFLLRLRQAKNHYEVFELSSTSPANEIKDAYYKLARSYHPDRFHLRSGTPLHSELGSAFARITHAYETLTDATARATYDQTLARARLFSESAPKPTKPQVSSNEPADAKIETDASTSDSDRAEYNFREGFGALEQGRVAAALTHLAAAARAVPDEARYRAYYGRALAGKEQTRRIAESELQAAIKLEPGNALFRVMLAELYFDLKFHRRAQAEVDRALALEPANAKARALLRKLEKSRKVG
jgi:curved DNA-binding protein CbpA